MQAEGAEVQTQDVQAAEPVGRPSGRSMRRTLGEGASRFGLLIAWAALIIGFGLARPDTFFSELNFDSIFNTGAIFVILTLGVLPSLSAGELDLSIGGVLGLSMMMTAYSNVNLGLPLGVAVLIALGIGLGVGLINAFLVVALGIESLIVTLGMGTLLAGLTYAVTAQPIFGLSNTLIEAASHPIWGLQPTVFYAIALTAILFYIDRFTAIGQFVFFTGAGRLVARLSGVRVNAVRAETLIFGSLMAAIAGILAAGTAGAADPTQGPSYLAACVRSRVSGQHRDHTGPLQCDRHVLCCLLSSDGRCRARAHRAVGLGLPGVLRWLSDRGGGDAAVDRSPRGRN